MRRLRIMILRSAMEREVTDADETTWTCLQAYAGLSDGTENQAAAQVKGLDDTYWVVCMPSGGARSVRLKLHGEWTTSYADEVLLREIAAKQRNS